MGLVKMPKKRYAALPVCKPCWELKYCPYGLLVELMPFAGDRQFEETPEEMYDRAKKTLRKTDIKNDNEVYQNMFFVMFSDPVKQEAIAAYRPEDVSCQIFGHACPVFVFAEPFTETKESRQSGRYIPREIMLQVVRRDNYQCRVCHKHVPDPEVEFDHCIPHSKGGPLTVENIRLLCRDCNRTKSDSLAEILEDFAWKNPPTEGE